MQEITLYEVMNVDITDQGSDFITASGIFFESKELAIQFVKSDDYLFNHSSTALRSFAETAHKFVQERKIKVFVGLNDYSEWRNRSEKQRILEKLSPRERSLLGL